MESISNNSIPEHKPIKQHRRRHSAAFKTEVLAACAEPGASIAAVAQRYQINANLVHKWRKVAAKSDRLSGEPAEFVSLPLGPSAPTTQDVTVTLSLGELTLQWPISHIHQAIPWLKALQS